MKLVYLIFLFGINVIAANNPNPAEEIDITSVASNQSILSENILENYLQPSEEATKILTKDIALFEHNLALLVEYSNGNELLKNLISENQQNWLEFKKITQTPIDDANISKAIDLSSSLFLLSEQFFIASQKIYLANIELTSI